MIEVTRIKGGAFWLNPELVETVESTPDTVVTLFNGHKYVVAESPAEIADRVMTYRQRAGFAPSLPAARDRDEDGTR